MQVGGLGLFREMMARHWRKFSWHCCTTFRQYAQSYIITKVDYQSKGSTVEMLLIR